MNKARPSLARLSEIGVDCENLNRQCDTSFQRQLALCPNSVQTLRRYAGFLLEVHSCIMLVPAL